MPCASPAQGFVIVWKLIRLILQSVFVVRTSIAAVVDIHARARFIRCGHMHAVRASFKHKYLIFMLLILSAAYQCMYHIIMII